jgi:hypothetical protein
MRTYLLSVLAGAIVLSNADAQAPTPIVVQAVTPAGTTKQNPVTAGVTTSATQTALKALQEMKAANEEILKQQKATLEKLDEMEKAANDIRIYTKRG